jgi:hypothetical protein
MPDFEKEKTDETALTSFLQITLSSVCVPKKQNKILQRPSLRDKKYYWCLAAL